jgi:protein-L-isoaspartate O-methyltransferase
MPAEDLIILNEHHARQYSLVEEAGIFDEALEQQILEALFKLPPILTSDDKPRPEVMSRSLAIRLVSLLIPKRADAIMVVGIEDGFTIALLEALSVRVFVAEENGIKAQKVRRLLDQHQFTKAITVVTPIEKGLPEYAPYDGILLHGLPKRVPQEIVNQLSDNNGRLVSLVGDEFTQQVTLHTKTSSGLKRTKFEIVQGYI